MPASLPVCQPGADGVLVKQVRHKFEKPRQCAWCGGLIVRGQLVTMLKRGQTPWVVACLGECATHARLQGLV